MFVFWYCHKRGKEVRLAREQAEGTSKEGGEELEVDASDTADESELEEMAEELEKAGSEAQGVASGEAQDDSLDRKTAALSQSNPADVPLPETTAVDAPQEKQSATTTTDEAAAKEEDKVDGK